MTKSIRTAINSEVKNTTATSGLITSDMIVEGNITAQGSLQIEGKVKGIVKVEHALTMSKSGEIQGKLFATDAMIDGRVADAIVASGRLALGPNAVVTGEIMTGKLIIDEGAVINAHCSTNGNSKSHAQHKSR